MIGFNTLRKHIKEEIKKTFISIIGVHKEHFKLLDFIFLYYLAPKGVYPVHLLWFMNFIREYRTWNSFHGSWGISWPTYHDAVLNVLEILHANMNFISHYLILADCTFHIGNKNIIGAVDSTEMEIERPKNKENRTGTLFFKLPILIPKGKREKRKFPKHPTFSGKQKKFTFKYETITTLIIGFIISLVGPVNGPIGDQVLARTHGLDKKIQQIGNEFEKEIIYTVAGDGHYTNFEGVTDRTQFNNKIERYYFHALRTKVETFNAWIKHFKILNSKYRQDRGDLESKKFSHAKFTNVICQIQNLKRILFYPEYLEKVGKSRIKNS